MADLVLPGTPFGTTYKRTTPRPMDSSEIFDSIEDARVYARNTSKAYVPYPGQIISVKGGAVYKLVIDLEMPDDSTENVFHCKLDIIGGNNDNDDRYLRRDIAETVQKLMTFLEGINVKGMATIEEITLLKNIVSQNFSIGSTGMGIYQDEAGNYHLDIDFVNIRKKLTADEIEVQKSYYVGGKQWITPGAGIICTSVEDTGAAYRCRFKTTDAEGRTVRCLFQTDDMAICETFNLTKQAGGAFGNHYYWRLVTAVGADYIDLSKSGCGAGSEAPQAGDEIVHLGNKSDTSRQGAICSDAITAGGPYIRVYKGISDYHLPQPNIDLNPEESIIKARLISESTGKDVDDIINDVQVDLDLIKEQTDKEYTLWFFEYTPTLTNIPASDWTTDRLKTLHEEDMFYNRASGLAYRFVKSGSIWKWADITDQQTIKALENASKAQDTADSKRRVFVAQPTDAQAYDVGDLWTNATYGSLYSNDQLVCQIAKAAGAAFNIYHWKPASTATTAYMENLGNQIILGVTTDTDEKIEALKKLAQDGIDSATEIANDAVDSIKGIVSDMEGLSGSLSGLSGRLDDADKTIAKHTTAIQATETSIALLAEGIHFDASGNITNINTSGLITEDDFNVLLSKKVNFDTEGHITNISTSGLVTEAGFAQMFSERAAADGYVKKSYIATFITELPDGSFQSNAIVSADKIDFKGGTVKISADNINFEGAIVDEINTLVTQSAKEWKIEVMGKDENGNPNSILAAINATEEGIKIKGDKVEIDGNLLADIIKASGLNINNKFIIHKDGAFDSKDANITGNLTASVNGRTVSIGVSNNSISLTMADDNSGSILVNLATSKIDGSDLSGYGYLNVNEFDEKGNPVGRTVIQGGTIYGTKYLFGDEFEYVLDALGGIAFSKNGTITKHYSSE